MSFIVGNSRVPCRSEEENLQEYCGIQETYCSRVIQTVQRRHGPPGGIIVCVPVLPCLKVRNDRTFMLMTRKPFCQNGEFRGSRRDSFGLQAPGRIRIRPAMTCLAIMDSAQSKILMEVASHRSPWGSHAPHSRIWPLIEASACELPPSPGLFRKSNATAPKGA